ncbi:MAG: hypothetical protein LBI31_00410 [Zoogloeaceae bacterium]|jgi:hypothetical protein|nr:hypothetical protein [Zoogloeaceae bacterium]
MEPEYLRLIPQVINMLGTFGIGCWLYIEKRNDKTNERVNEQGKRIGGHEKKLVELESLLANSPRHEDLTRVYEAINALGASVNQMIGENRMSSDFLKLLLKQLTEKGMR